MIQRGEKERMLQRYKVISLTVAAVFIGYIDRV